jgi:CPA1 family monovalent cation:H+ antiporter
MLPSGEAFPMRSLLIFLTYSTILTTLLIPSLTLPRLLRALGLKAGDENFREEMMARLVTTRAVQSAFPDLGKKHARLSTILEQIQTRYERRVRIFESNLKDQPYSELFDEDRHTRQLLRDMIQLERESLIKLRHEGAIHDEVFHTIARELDLEELRLKTQRI